MHSSVSNEMTTEPIRKLFWRYTLPTLMAVLVNGLYVTVDGIFVGRYIGANGLAAINLMWPLYGTVLGLGGMIGTAGAALFSIEKGRNNFVQAKKYIGNSFLLLGVMAVLVYVLLRLFARQALVLQIPNDSGMVEMTMAYVYAFQPLAFLTLCATALPLLIRNDEAPRLATKLMIIGALLNVVGDYFLIARFGYGIAGAAYATLFAQAVVTLLGFGYFFSKKARARLVFSDLRLSFEASYKTFFLGFSSFFMYVYFSSLSALYNYTFARYGSSVTVAAYALVGYAAGFFYLFSEGITAGVQPLISYNFGAKKYYNIRRTLLQAVKVIVVSSAIFLAVLYIFPEQIISIFNKNDDSLRQEALLGLRLHLITCYLEAFILLSTVYFQSVDDGKKATLISVMNLFIQVPFVFILPIYFGIAGIWLAFPVANIPLALVVFFVLIKDLRLKTRSLKERHQTRFKG